MTAHTYPLEITPDDVVTTTDALSTGDVVATTDGPKTVLDAAVLTLGRRTGAVVTFTDGTSSYVTAVTPWVNIGGAVGTWANGHGIWHARVSRDAVAPLLAARRAIRDELTARQSSPVPRDVWSRLVRVPDLDDEDTIVYREGVVLTTAQRAALDLLVGGPVWARGRGRFAVTGGNVADRRVLDALVATGHARFVRPAPSSRTLPYYVKVG